MKEYIPFLIAIAIAAARMYSNFQKEQEKARKRNPSLPGGEGAPGQPVPPPPARKSPPVPPKPAPPLPKPKMKPEPVLIKETTDPRRPYEPVYTREYREPVYEKPVVEKYTPEKRVTPHRVELSNPEDISEETSLNRTIHQPHKHRFELLTHDDEESAYEFDMRDAVIKEAILNRPQY